jgi:predicted 3-demethylubiquinone-9 3-methyltransferase (glyoxalase superfamily)
MSALRRITPWLWFESEAEEAATFYVSVFDNSRVTTIRRYGSAGPGAEGSVMTVEFELDGQPLSALNGGQDFPFTEAISFEVTCTTQEEIDHYWSVMSEGGSQGPCGWLKDRYGLSWQVVPVQLNQLVDDPDEAKGQRAMAAMLQMQKLVIADLEAAAAG